jgi:hypothetical protein
MGPTTVGPALSVRQLLVDSPQSAKEQVGKHLDALVKLPLGISRDQAIEAILGLLDIPLADVIFPAWEQYNDVRRAIAETRDQPGVVRQVRVAGHTLTSTHHPTLECDLDGNKLFLLELELDLSLHFAGVVITIARGEIMAIGPGDATVTASLKTAKGVTLIPERQLIVLFSEPVTQRPAAANTATVQLTPVARSS